MSYSQRNTMKCIFFNCQSLLGCEKHTLQQRLMIKKLQVDFEKNMELFIVFATKKTFLFFKSKFQESKFNIYFKASQSFKVTFFKFIFIPITMGMSQQNKGIYPVQLVLWVLQFHEICLQNSTCLTLFPDIFRKLISINW